MSGSRRLAKLSLSALTLIVGTAAIELLARFYIDDGYFVWPPGLQRVSELEPGVVHGVSGPTRVRINSLGLRGSEQTGRERVRILALGGSTTISLYLDDSETWTHLVQEHLNQALGDEAVWVGNGGRAGHTTAQHVLQAEKLLAQLPNTDLVLMLVGANDLMLDASWKLEDTQARRASSIAVEKAPDDALKLAFAVVPLGGEPGPWYRRTALARLWTSSRAELPAGPSQDGSGEFVRELRQYRREASRLVAEIPNLDGALAGYTRRLHAIADVAQANGTTLVFLTQPTLWSADLPPEGMERLMFGGPPLSRRRSGAPYYSVEALVAGMTAYNATLLHVCQARGLTCIDVASDLRSDLRLFWDDFHFTEEGHRRVAASVASGLLIGPLRADSDAGSR